MLKTKPQATPPLTEMSKYTFGTTRLGDDRISFRDRVKIARSAIDADIWLHTSHTYGDALDVLRAAFDEDRSNIPPTIFKIGWDSIDQIREVIEKNIRSVGTDHMSVGQLCLGGPLGEEFRSGGPCYERFRELKEEGLVERFVLEVWPWNSSIPYDALQAGYPEGVIDGYIFYMNPLQRFVSNNLWNLLLDRNESVVAMRTLSGGDIHKLAANDSKAPEYLRKRAAEVVPIFERSGAATWCEFSLRYVFGFSNVRTSIGSTGRLENLAEFLTIVKSITALPADVQSELTALQWRWSSEHDHHAAAWSM